jgi:hypothetical protein
MFSRPTSASDTEHNALSQDFTLPRGHPIWSALLRAQKRRNNIGNYARFPLAEALKTMDLQRLNEQEMIDPSTLPPWRAEVFAEVEIGPDREIAAERAETARAASDIVVFSDALSREGHLGAAVAALNNSPQVVESQQIQVGPMDLWLIHVAELIGIFYAISMVFKIAHQRLCVGHTPKAATILCDSRSALQTTQNPRNRSGPRIARAILQAATEVQAEEIALRLQWVPGHCNNPGTMQRIDQPRTPRAQAKPTLSALYCQGKVRACAAISLTSGSRNGGYPTKVVTCERLIAPYQQPTQGGCMGACPGTGRTC